MCFSATANFTSSAVIAISGIATVAISRHPHEWLFAAIKAYAFASVWCAYTAVGSLLIYGHFYRRRPAERRGQVPQH